MMEDREISLFLEMKEEREIGFFQTKEDKEIGLFLETKEDRVIFLLERNKTENRPLS